MGAATTTREHLASRIAAACLIAGSTCVLVARVAHGDLPTDTGEEALSFVAAQPLYPLKHFADWLGVLVWTGRVVCVSDRRTRAGARSIRSGERAGGRRRAHHRVFYRRIRSANTGERL